MTPSQEKAYKDVLADLEAERLDLISMGEEGKAAGVRLSMALRARQAAVCSWDTTGTHWKPIVAGKDASAQLAWILDEFMEPRGYLPDDFDATLGKVVIVSYFTEELHWLQQELANEGVESMILEGDTPAPEKKYIEAEFQNGALRVVLLSGHLGVSINLDAADDMIFIDYPHKDPDKMEQAEDRIHRASSNHQVTIWRLIPKATIMVEIVREMDKRYADTRRSYDGSRGAVYEREFVRDLLGYGSEAAA
jgi:SNF2 family DNA or RNA helicase